MRYKTIIFLSIFVSALALMFNVFVEEIWACEYSYPGTYTEIQCPESGEEYYYMQGAAGCSCGEDTARCEELCWECGAGYTCIHTDISVSPDSSCSGDYCVCWQISEGPCPSDGGDGEEQAPTCQISAKLGTNREVTFSIGTEGGGFNQYQLDYGDGSEQCTPNPCPLGQSTFNHTYTSSGYYDITFTLFQDGTQVTDCGIGQLSVLNCQGTVAPNDMGNIRNLQCPQKALIGSSFPVSYEFQGVGPDWQNRYEVRMGGRMTVPSWLRWLFGRGALLKEWCAYGQDFTEGLWCLDDTQELTCPSGAGTYTFGLQGIGTSYSDSTQCNYPDEYDDEGMCNVQCVATLPTHLLTVTRQGTGSGTITSNPAGVNCGSDCQETYSDGTQVTLTASPSAGSTFAGWSGACSGAFSTCTLTVDNNKTVTATFQATSIGHVRIQGTSGLIKLNLISVADAIAALKGVIKIALPGGAIGAADLVETSDTAASPVRVRTPYGIKSWRKIQ